MIFLYNWLKIICKKESLISLSNLRLIKNKKVSISNARSDIALNTLITI